MGCECWSRTTSLPAGRKVEANLAANAFRLEPRLYCSVKRIERAPKQGSAESAPLRRAYRRAAALLPYDPQRRRIELPADRYAADGELERAVLGGVGGELVKDQGEGRSLLRRQFDLVALRRYPRLAIVRELRGQNLANIHHVAVRPAEQLVGGGQRLQTIEYFRARLRVRLQLVAQDGVDHRELVAPG